MPSPTLLVRRSPQVDVGVGRPTADMRHESALTTERFDSVVQITATAFAAVDDLDSDLLDPRRDSGIGNTTALPRQLLPRHSPVARPTIVGRARNRRRRRRPRSQARRRPAGAPPHRRRRRSARDPPRGRRCRTGRAMAAAAVAARHRSIPVVLDGYISCRFSPAAGHVVGADRRSTIASSATARPSPATACSSSASGKRPAPRPRDAPWRGLREPWPLVPSIQAWHAPAWYRGRRPSVNSLREPDMSAPPLPTPTSDASACGLHRRVPIP